MDRGDTTKQGRRGSADGPNGVRAAVATAHRAERTAADAASAADSRDADSHAADLRAADSHAADSHDAAPTDAAPHDADAHAADPAPGAADDAASRRPVDRACLLHIGYHKCGSTWLQQTLFRDRPAGWNLRFEDRAELNRRLVEPRELAWDPAPVRDWIDAERARPDAADHVTVLSHERFSGNPHSGGFDSLILMRRLREVVPDARVLIVVREQRAAIRSSWMQYVKVGGPASCRDYLSRVPIDPTRIPLFHLDHFAYDRLVAAYQDAFGRDRVLVLPFELLRTDAADFARRIHDFADVRPPTQIDASARNVSLSALATTLKRRFNLPLVRTSMNPAGLIESARWNGAIVRGFQLADRAGLRWFAGPFERRVRRTVATAIGDRYRASNARLAERTGLDLGALGYDV